MGTRADFYIGNGPEAEWLGSIGMDGYPDGIDATLLAATTEETFREEVAKFLAADNYATVPSQGWPWPWDNSRTTDYAYMLIDGEVKASYFGHAFFDPKVALEEEDDSGPGPSFPDMSARKNMTLGPRSGLIVIGG